MGGSPAAPAAASRYQLQTRRRLLERPVQAKERDMQKLREIIAKLHEEAAQGDVPERTQDALTPCALELNDLRRTLEMSGMLDEIEDDESSDGD
jgi:hypothetical protein